LDHNGSLSDQLVVENVTLGDEPIQCFVFFFSRGCPHCAIIRDYIDGDLRNANVTFHYEAYDVRKSDYSRRLIAGYQYFGWNGTHAVPTIFIGEEDDMSVLVGEAAIFDQLLPRIQELQSNPTTCYDFARLLEDLDLEIGGVQWGVLTAAALVDSINPCAIAVLLILLGGLVMSVVPEEVHPESSSTSRLAIHPVPMDDQPESPEYKKEETESEQETKKNERETETSDLDVERMAVCSGDEEVISPSTASAAVAAIIATDSQNGTAASSSVSERNSRRRRAFISGMAFILAVFIAYYALGFGIFTAVSSTQASSIILLVLGIFVIFLGAWNIKDFLCYDKGYNVEIPRSWRPLLKRLLGAVTSPLGAFAAGFIVCLFELPCTGGPYLFVLALLADQNTRTEAAFLLLYYNFIFVLPLIIIDCLVFWSAPMLEKVGAWKEKRIHLLHLFAGLVLIALGVLAVVNSQKPLF
jgi:cytochrome c biogenesis protein CcdA/glutaredoxin